VCALLAVEELGHGEPLVLIHGLATNHNIWGLVAPPLARSRRVVLLDVPGFGGSEPAGEGFDLAEVAERIARGLAAQGVRGPFDLVGHSLGGAIALTLAARRPRLVRRLVLVAPAGLAAIPAPAAAVLAAASDGLLSVRRRLAPLAELRWGRRILLALTAADGASISPTQARMMVAASAGARRTASALAALNRADLLPLLKEVNAPLGVIWGAQDRTVPVRLAATVREARPDAEIVTIDHAGHVVMVERPEAFVTALEGLLARLPKHETTPSAEPTTLA
jgi:3-oxoadipate enol-lactonase